MKKFFLMIAISSMIVSCSDENKSTQKITGEIVGQWKLIYRHSNPWSSYISDESSKNIVYKNY